MKKRNKSILMLAMISFLTVTTLFFLGLSDVGGKQDKPDPMEPVMTMLEDIYEIVLDTNSKVEGVLIQRTGQNSCWDTGGSPIDCEGTGQDGELKRGVAWADPRFTDNVNGTVTDNLTGLIWLKNSNCFGQRNWATALTDCSSLNSGGGECGLTDGSVEGDWRLPNINELQSLIDYSQSNPVLPPRHFFTDLPGDPDFFYWSSTTAASPSDYAWGVHMSAGTVPKHHKISSYYVWPVRGGN